jgi:hypothetical protein
MKSVVLTAVNLHHYAFRTVMLCSLDTGTIVSQERVLQTEQHHISENHNLKHSTLRMGSPVIKRSIETSCKKKPDCVPLTQTFSTLSNTLCANVKFHLLKGLSF